MKKLSFILLFLLVSAACSRNEKDNTAELKLSNPTEELAWLKEIKTSLTNCTCEMSIIQAEYDGQTVFYIAMTDPLCDGIQSVVLYDSNGKPVKTLTNDEYISAGDKLSNKKILYRCKTAG